MDKKKLIKRIVLYGSAVLFINYASIPFGDWVYQTQIKEIEDKRIQEVCKTEDYLPELKKFESDEVLFYLKAAHVITSKFLSSPLYFKARQDPKYKKYKSKLHGKTERPAAFDGVADCEYFSVFTYSNFNYLCDELGKPGLKKYVRYSEGRVKDLEGEWNHVWLQYKKNGRWINYDTVLDFFSENDTLDFKILKFLNPLQGKSYATYFIDSKDGKLKGHMHFKNILKGKANLLLQVYEDLSGKNSNQE